MFAEVVPSLSVGEVTKVRSSSGFHLVYLADAVGGERVIRQTDVRHILIKPTEVLSEEAAEALAVELKTRIGDGESFGDLRGSIQTTLGRQRKAVNWAGPIPDKWCPNLKPQWRALLKARSLLPFEVSLAGTFWRSKGVEIRTSLAGTA